MGGAGIGNGTFVGLDVHARGVVAGLIDEATGEVRIAPAPHRTDALVGWLGALTRPVRVAYEAGPTGFCLARACETAGIECLVAAPSLIARSPAGRGRKSDVSDAERLARPLRRGQLTSVRVPDPADEAARDLVRAREDARADLMRARHRLSKLLLRHGLVYEQGRAWTTRHEAWLRAQRLEHPGARAAFEDHDGAVLGAGLRREGLDRQIAQMASEPRFAPVVRRLGCLRGVGTLTAFALAVEIGDFHRLSGRTIGACLGLVAERVPVGRPPRPGADHQGRQLPGTAPSGRGRLASPPRAAREHRDRAPPRLSAPRGARPRRAGGAQAPPPLAPPRAPPRASLHGRGDGGGARAGGLVLEPCGDAAAAGEHPGPRERAGRPAKDAARGDARPSDEQPAGHARS